MKILLSFTHPHVIPKYDFKFQHICLNQPEEVEIMTELSFLEHYHFKMSV